VKGAMPKFLVELILVVEAKSLKEARKIADYIVNMPIPKSEIENAIEIMRCEEIVEVRELKVNGNEAEN
jgi:hypothetical protein